MKSFIFYFKNDPTKSQIFKINAYCINEAIENFAILKNLNVNTFLNLYNVEEVQC